MMVQFEKNEKLDVFFEGLEASPESTGPLWGIIYNLKFVVHA